MITTCTGCHARFRLDGAKVPPRKIRVRCPDCGTVFGLDGTCRDEPVTAPPPAAVPRLSGLEDASAVLGPARRASAPAPASGSRDLDLAPAAATPAAGVQTAVAEPRGARRRRRDKTEMLARALVSDILVYNRTARDKALAEGNLLEALGPEIKKSWELYKEKVGAEAATQTAYFKDALNEILADGQRIF